MEESDLSDLMINPHTEKPYLSDVIDFSRDIKPYPFICLWAGVGAGKNTLIENIINGCPEKGIPPQIVLLISSRKSKIIETLNEESLDISNHFTNVGNVEDILLNAPYPLQHYRHLVDDDGFKKEIYQRSLVCTNAAIEAYHQYYFDPADPTTHLWNRFDMIVWDEAHSLIKDSSYQSAPYHVLRLLQETYQHMKEADSSTRCKHLILMTGTPDPLRLITLPKRAHLLDLRETCRNVSAKNIHFLNTKQADQQIKTQLNDGERVVYFANHIELPSALSEKYEIPRDQIVVSFSDNERRIKLKKASAQDAANHPNENYESDYERMENVEKHLYKHESIRPDIALFCSTSRNKEGINIQDSDIRHVYIESHSLTDIKQMAGRIRKGAEHVYIIIDSKGYGNTEPQHEQKLDKDFCNPALFDTGISPADALLNRFCADRKLSISTAYRTEASEVGQYIDLLKSKFPYIQFDHFARKFRFNLYRELSYQLQYDELKEFDDAVESTASLIELFQNEFPYATIHAYHSPVDEGSTYVQLYIDQHPDEFHPYDEILAIALHLRALLGAPQRSKNTDSESISNPNLYLHKVGFHFKRRHNNASHENYNFCTLKPYTKSTRLTSEVA